MYKEKPEFVTHCPRGHPRKLEFGGESPLTMRHGRWVINQHSLGPSTRKRFEIAICSNPYATVGAAIVSRVT